MRYLETDKNFYRKVVSIALPIAAQSMITIGVNMVDTIMLGKLGETALSASSLANQFITFFQICCMGIGMGASVLTSRYWGGKDSNSLKKTITIALRFAIFFAAIFTFVNIMAPEMVLRMYSNEEPIIREGVIYLRWSSVTFLLMSLSIVCTNIMRSVNLVRIPLFASICAFLINIGANYIFIFGKFGAPEMGVAGAALGTVIARVVETGFICGYFFFVDKKVGYRIKNLFHKCADLVREYLCVSIPVLVSDGLLGLGNNAVGMVMGHIGGDFVAANAITTVTQQLSMVFILGMSFSGCIVTGQTLGEGRVEDAKKQGFTFSWMRIIIGCLAGVIIYMIRTPSYQRV